MLLLANLVKPVIASPLKHCLFIMTIVSESCGRGRTYPKQFLFISFNLSNRHWTLLFVNLKTKILYILDPLAQHVDADLANKASSEISFLKRNLVTRKDLQCCLFCKTMLLVVVYFHVTIHRR